MSDKTQMPSIRIIDNYQGEVMRSDDSDEDRAVFRSQEPGRPPDVYKECNEDDETKVMLETARLRGVPTLDELRYSFPFQDGDKVLITRNAAGEIDGIYIRRSRPMPVADVIGNIAGGLLVFVGGGLGANELGKWFGRGMGGFLLIRPSCAEGEANPLCFGDGPTA
jgi:hypothetical protein